MKLLSSLEKWFNKTLSALMAIMFLVMILLVTAQVFSRFFLDTSMAWSEEISRYLLVWTVFFGTTMVYQEHGHVWVANVVDAVPPTARKIILFISYLIQFVFFAAVLWGTYIYYPTAAMRTSPVNLLPLPLVYLCVPIAAFCMEMFCIRDIVKLFTGRHEEL
ncbi:TRAP transporter small permease [Desulfosporosinus fructosivorans]|uniref:TRAP transporter small permease n=1 Tax=Desulfosporosinus fructosivorans TaxID=2018669 RepID=A0A4Z0R8V6_9FIRM|nr:TRAP transporter small permease [Desulfosporosinus fructosivorans]TGE39260.1 TRAP transporter small permease [Desulfosporosinus fructosivorans]